MGGLLRALGLIRGAVADKEIPPPEIKIDFEIILDATFDDDADEIVEPELECIGRCFGIVYVDSRGRKSQRRITVKSLKPQESDLLIRAFCHERQATRSFKASRIQQIVDLDTGEVAEDASEFFATYLSDDPTYEALRECGPGLQVLTFMARCDGEFHEFEKDCIVEYVLEKADHSVDTYAVEKHVEGLHPDSESFERGLVITSERGEAELKDLISWLKKVVDADGVVSDEEFNWLLEVEDILAV